MERKSPPTILDSQPVERGKETWSIFISEMLSLANHNVSARAVHISYTADQQHTLPPRDASMLRTSRGHSRRNRGEEQPVVIVDSDSLYVLFKFCVAWAIDIQ